MDNIKSARSVYMQTSPVTGDHRTRKLELIAGDDNPITFYKEYGCRFKVDVEQTYFRLDFLPKDLGLQALPLKMKSLLTCSPV